MTRTQAPPTGGACPVERTMMTQLTPAEFKCLRVSIGLTTRWLAQRWGVAEYSVKRWENSRMLPEEFSDDMIGLRKRFLDEVSKGVAARNEALLVPRVDRDTNLGFPAQWWQLIAWQIHAKADTMLLYYDDYTEDLEPEPDDLDPDDEQTTQS